MSGTADWIAVDWGTSNLRLWALDATGEVIAERASDQGMGRLTPDQFETVLLDLCDGLLDAARCTDVVICGMAGARQGWAEAPYLAVPIAMSALGAGGVVPPVASKLISVRILPGLSQQHPADVMRGEETQISGFCATHEGFEGALCLPGTHSKWVRVAGGEISRFRTVMTGEVFALLSEQSVLRHSLAKDLADAADLAQEIGVDAAFSGAVRQAFDAPEIGFAALFALRAESLLHGAAAAPLRARLSGGLIGAELAATRDLWEGQPVAVIGAGPLAALYVAALAELGTKAALKDGSHLALHGLRAARSAL